MSLINISIFLVFAHLSETHVLILRDYDDVPFDLDRGSMVIEPKQEAISLDSRYRPKKMQSLKETILQYGRHIYHFDDLKELWSKISGFKKPLKDGPVSYEYLDINDWRALDSAKDVAGEYPKDLLILSGSPLHFCNGDDCGEDRKTFRKYDDHKDWKQKKKQLEFIKRFQIVERHPSTKEPERTKYDSLEKNLKKNKTSKKQKKKKKKQNDSSESMDSNSKERSSESWESEEEKKYSSEKSSEYIKKPKKIYVSMEDWTDESNSVENIPKIKKKYKEKNHKSSEETKRKKMAVEDDYFMQGNKIFHSKDRKKKKRLEYDGRRRLQHFLPKRYHWQPEEIHQLGSFWFNGPKGAYPAPKPL